MTNTVNSLSDKYGLRNHAVLVRFTKSAWGITKKDKEASAKLVSETGAQSNMLGVYKKLIDPSQPQFKAITKNQGVGSNIFRSMTGPWDAAKGGFWIITTQGLPQLQTVFDGLEQKHDGFVSDFIKALPGILADAEAKGGTTYDASLIPSPEEIREKFQFNLEVKVLEDNSQNAILNLSDKIKDAIGDAAKAKEVERFKGVADHVEETVREKLGEMLTNLREYGDDIKGTKRKRSFKDTQIDHMKALCDLLPALNITGDQRLDKLAQDIAKHLTLTSADDLRGNKKPGDNRSDERREADAAKAREDTADKTEQLINDLDSVFGDVEQDAA
jgi:hypothetical protein